MQGWYNPSGARFSSLSNLNSWVEAQYTGDGICTLNFTGSSNGAVQSSQYGIPIYFNIFTSYTGTASNTDVPPCSNPFNATEVSTAERSVICPAGFTLIYQGSPALGPTCSFPVATASLLKQAGCPTCGSTVKSDPVDVSNGNHYQGETDYVGAGNNPIKFVRSYNSLIARQVVFSLSLEIGEQFVGKGGWTASYFQYLLPVSVTDSTTTHNTVYAYRPDGRVLTFSQYAGVYSPDGDVADRLVPVSGGGWQYQTADDTIETYDAAGQLLSIAARGQASVTINYNTGSSLGDPPVSVSDAFGHSLQFAYLLDATGVQRLASITDPDGKVTSYSYDSTWSRPTTVTHPDGTTRKYGYATTGSNGFLLAGLIDEAASTYASWTYDTYGSQVRTSQLAGGVAAYSFSYATNANGTITSATVTDPLGVTRTHAQQLASGVNYATTVSSPCPGCGDDQSRLLDANGNITSRSDFNGTLVQFRVFSGS
jgi:YD repeat-containing protein